MNITPFGAHWQPQTGYFVTIGIVRLEMPERIYENAETAMLLGERLAKVRGTLSQRSFASMIPCALNTLKRYEVGERVPDAVFLLRISELTGCSVEWLVTGVEQPSSNKSVEQQVDYLAEAVRELGGAIPAELIPREEIVAWLREWWDVATADQHVWLREQLRRSVPEFAAWEKKRSQSEREDTA